MRAFKQSGDKLTAEQKETLRRYTDSIILLLELGMAFHEIKQFLVIKKPEWARRWKMVRNIYEDTIFVITNKLNNKLDVLLSSSNDKHNMDIDQSVIEFAKITSNFNNLLIEVIKRNAMVKEFVSERDKH